MRNFQNTRETMKICKIQIFIDFQREEAVARLKKQNERMEHEIRQKHQELIDKITELDQLKLKLEDNWTKMQSQ